MSFKICVIGCGNMSQNGHGPSYRKYKALHPEVQLAACCDLDLKKAEEYAKEFGFENIYSDYKKMLDYEKPDVVCLISPVQFTSALSVDIINQGYPLILEKPPGLNIDETLKIIHAAEAKNVPVRVAFNRRYMPLVRYLKNELSKRKSAIQNITYTFIRTGRTDPDFSTTAIHGIDAAKYLVGSEYMEIDFEYRNIPNYDKHIANIYMHCKFESGTVGQLIFEPMGGCVIERAVISIPNVTYFLELPVWNTVDSPGRLLKMENNQITKIVTGNDISDGEEMFESNGFYAENEIFFNELRRGVTPYSDVASGLQSVDIANHIRNRITKYKK